MLRHLRGKILLSSLVVVVPFIVWNAAMQVGQYRESRRQAILTEKEIAGDVAAGYRDMVGDLLTTERAMGLLLGAENGIPTSQIPTYIRRVVRGSKPDHIIVLHADGTALASDIPGMQGFDASGFPDVRKVMAGAPWAVSRIFYMPQVGEHVFVVTSRVESERSGERLMISGIMDTKGLERALTGTVAPGILKDGTIVVTDNAGVVAFAPSLGNLTWKERHWEKYPFVRQALSGKTAVIENFILPNGQKALGVAKPLGISGWTVTVFIPMQRVFGPIDRQALYRAVFILLLMGLAFGTAAYTAGRISRPMIDLAETSRRLGSGDLSARARVQTGDEVELLGASINEMADSLQARTVRMNEAMEAERRQAQRISTLYTVAQGIIVNVELSGRLGVIAQALASICELRRCAICLRRGDSMFIAAGWGLPEETIGLTVQLNEYARASLESIDPAAPILIPDAGSDPRLDPEIIEMFDLKSLIILPLVRHSHLVGLAVLDNCGALAECGEEALDTARGLANIAAIAVENSETFAKNIKIAQAFQKAMLPAVPDRVDSFQAASRYYSALEIAELGGDFYDFIPLPGDRVGLVIADVSGKGLDAAVLTAMGKYTLRSFACEDPSPTNVLARTNHVLTVMDGGWGFLTIFYGVLHLPTGKLTYSCAGHPMPIVTRKSGEVFSIPCECRHPPLGILEGMEFTEEEYFLGRGDALVGYTDGVIETRRDGGFFGEERLVEVIGKYMDQAPDEIAEAIHSAVMEFGQGRIQDDIALLVIKR
ncbi:MAG: SpoIIE family protein phosphatase [Armatimonadota bacterium]